MTDTKTVSYLDQNFEVPLWANFIAADATDEVFASSTEPRLVDGIYWLIDYSVGQAECVGRLASSAKYPCMAI